jgi:metallo-beta-lactamase family protein
MGSAQVLMDLKWSRRNSHKFPFKLLNTWDLWRFSDNNLLNTPTITSERVDATVIEWTYGGRGHAKRQPEVHALLEGIKSAENLFVLPAFSLQRFQEIMFVLWQALESGELKLKRYEKIYCVSPIAYEFAMILMRQDAKKYWFLSDPIFFRVQSKEDIQHVDSITKQRKVVIAGWGMWQWWSSVKYIHQALQNPDAHIWLTGYQAVGTLGKEILDKSWTTDGVDIWGKISPVRAHVRQLRSFSSHADEQELVSYMQKLNIKSKHETIITHGWEQRIDLKNAMQQAGIQTTYHIPDLFDTISIETVKDRRKKGYVK